MPLLTVMNTAFPGYYTDSKTRKKFIKEYPNHRFIQGIVESITVKNDGIHSLDLMVEEDKYRNITYGEIAQVYFRGFPPDVSVINLPTAESIHRGDSLIISPGCVNTTSTVMLGEIYGLFNKSTKGLYLFDHNRSLRKEK